MGKMTRTRRTLIAADMARMLRELEQTSAQSSSDRRDQRPSHRSGATQIVRGK